MSGTFEVASSQHSANPAKLAAGTGGGWRSGQPGATQVIAAASKVPSAATGIMIWKPEQHSPPHGSSGSGVPLGLANTDQVHS